MSGIRKFVGDTVIYGLTTVISRVLNFLLTPLFVKKFEPTVYGIFTNLYAYAALINAVLAFGMETTYFRFLQRVKPEEKEKVFNNSFIVTIFASAVFVLSMFVFAHPIATYLGGNHSDVQQYEDYVKLFAVILSADALAVVPFAKLRAQQRPIRYGVVKIVNILVLIFCNLLLLYWLPVMEERFPSLQGLTQGWYQPDWLGNVFISNLIASMVTLVLLAPQIATFKFAIDKTLIRQMIGYSFPILVANISFIINEHLDKMMFPRLVPTAEGARDLGIYGAVAKIAVFLNLFITAFRLGAEPFFFSYAKNVNSGKVYAKIMDYFIVAMVLVMVGLCANIEWLKYFIKGGEFQKDIYWSGLSIVPILLLNNVLLGIYMNLSIWYKLSDQTKYGLYISSVGAMITIVLNILFIPKFSYLGAALSTTVTYCVMVAMSYFLGQKHYPIPYDVQKNVSYIAVAVGVSAIMFYVFDKNLWLCNLLFVLMLGGVAYSERKFILSLMARRK